MSSAGQSAKSTHNFNTIAVEDYDESIAGHVMKHLTQRRTSVIRAAQAAGKVLDVGCGTGRLLSSLPGDQYVRYGVDLSAGMVAQAQVKDQRLRCGIASATQLPFPDDAFDVVFCAAVLHHVAEPIAVVQAIHEMIRVTRPGGTAIIWDHNPLNPYWPIIMRRVPQDIGEERLIPRSEMDAALQTLAKTYRLHTRWRHMTFIPDFAPTWSMNVLPLLEQVAEQTPLIQWLSAHNVAIVTKLGRS